MRGVNTCNHETSAPLNHSRPDTTRRRGASTYVLPESPKIRTAGGDSPGVADDVVESLAIAQLLAHGVHQPGAGVAVGHVDSFDHLHPYRLLGSAPQRINFAGVFVVRGGTDAYMP